jgi:hypothetical protein
VNAYATQARIARPMVRPRPTHYYDQAPAPAQIVEVDRAGWLFSDWSERIEDWRVIWRQTTFYLFDAVPWP